MRVNKGDALAWLKGTPAAVLSASAIFWRLPVFDRMATSNLITRKPSMAKRQRPSHDEFMGPAT